MEERAAHEALQLEKRLSLLSHAGRPGSGGDDRSLSSSSSDAGHSDVSASSRLTAWPELSSSSASTSQEGPGLATARALHLGEGEAPGEAALGPSRPPPKPPRPRQLQDVGRQGSSDSGIATGSHSSCSGSLSSYAGSSLDVWRAAEELGSLLSLCACPPGAAPRAEYQVPGPPRHHYDTPRGLRPAPRDQSPAPQGGPEPRGPVAAPDARAAEDSGGQSPCSWPGAARRGPASEAPGGEAARPGGGPGEPWEAPPAACPVCGGLQVAPPP